MTVFSSCVSPSRINKVFLISELVLLTQLIMTVIGQFSWVVSFHAFLFKSSGRDWIISSPPPSVFDTTPRAIRAHHVKKNDNPQTVNDIAWLHPFTAFCSL